MRSLTSKTLLPLSQSKPSTKAPKSSRGAMTSSPSCLLSLKSSLPAPGAVWTTPVPSDSLTSFHATTLRSTPCWTGSSSNGPLVPEPRERGARHLLQYLVAGLELGQPRLEQVQHLAVLCARLGVD